MNANLKASTTPVEAIEKVTYAGQDPKKRMYRRGYEIYMNAMPVLEATDRLLDSKLALSKDIMKRLADELADEDGWATDADVPDGEFTRTIIAIEDSFASNEHGGMEVKEGKELVVAKWGDGFSSPVHGHAAGFLHEELLAGKMIVNTYRMIAPDSNVVRLAGSEIFKGHTTIASSFATVPPDSKFKRQALIHNFQSIGFSSSLHYVPEHTRDGRDNAFEVEYFEDAVGLRPEDVKQITSQEGLYLRKGDVCLVRSTNVPDYGDHFIVITGGNVVKEHGLRPQDTAFVAPHASGFIDQFTLKTGLTLLKLNEAAKKSFHEFHGISIVNGQVIMPKA